MKGNDEHKNTLQALYLQGIKKPREIGVFERRRPDLNRWILVLQTIALPLGYYAIF